MTKRVLFVAAALAVLMAGGCGRRKFTREKYDTLYDGQLSSQVERTLGRPYVRTANRWTYIHQKPYYKAVILFDEDGRLVGKAWSNEKASEDAPNGG